MTAEKDGSFLEELFDAALAEQKAEIINVINEMKCDERKTREFGEWVAETFNDKMLVNSVVKEILKAIKDL